MFFLELIFLGFTLYLWALMTGHVVVVNNFDQQRAPDYITYLYICAPNAKNSLKPG